MTCDEHRPRQRHDGHGAGFLRRLAAWRTPGGAAALPAPGSAQEPVFVRIAHPAGTLWVNRDLRNERLEKAIMTGWQGLAEHFRLEPVHTIGGSRVNRFSMTLNGTPCRVYCKEFVARSPLDQLKRLVRPSRAVRDMNASSLLNRHGFRTAQVVLAAEVRTGLLRSTSFLVTLEITDVRPVAHYLIPESDAAGSRSLRERRRLLRQFGLIIGCMHRYGIAHGDLRERNTLVRRREGSWEFFFIDNERTRKWFRLPARARRKNLVQVNMLPWGISHTDRLRFFRAYLRMNPALRPRYRQWAGRIMAVTRRRLLSLKERGRLDKGTWYLAAAAERAERKDNEA